MRFAVILLWLAVAQGVPCELNVTVTEPAVGICIGLFLGTCRWGNETFGLCVNPPYGGLYHVCNGTRILETKTLVGECTENNQHCYYDSYDGDSYMYERPGCRENPNAIVIYQPDAPCEINVNGTTLIGECFGNFCIKERRDFLEKPYVEDRPYCMYNPNGTFKVDPPTF